MSESEMMDVMRHGLWVAFLVSLPLLTVALAVGLVIGLVQALTSVQEMTLTFVPKLGAMALVFWMSMSFMTGQLLNFWDTTLVPAIEGN